MYKPVCYITDPSLSVTHNDTSLNMKEGDNMVLYCNTSGYPPPMVHWTRRIKNGNNQWANGEYFIWVSSIFLFT